MCQYTIPKAGGKPRGVAGTPVVRAVRVACQRHPWPATPLGAADPRARNRACPPPCPNSAPAPIPRTVCAAADRVRNVESGCSVSLPTPGSMGQTLWFRRRMRKKGPRSPQLFVHHWCSTSDAVGPPRRRQFGGVVADVGPPAVRRFSGLSGPQTGIPRMSPRPRLSCRAGPRPRRRNTGPGF